MDTNESREIDTRSKMETQGSSEIDTSWSKIDTKGSSSIDTRSKIDTKDIVQ